MSFFISDVWAAAGNPITGAGDNGMFSLMMIAGIFVLFYFMMIKPQNKRMKEHQELLNRLRKGDEIITTGGILAKIVSLNEQYMKVSLSDGVDVLLQKSAVSSILPKGTLKSL
jgi:preprotein translocase subunit YajC